MNFALYDYYLQASKVNGQQQNQQQKLDLLLI